MPHQQCARSTHSLGHPPSRAAPKHQTAPLTEKRIRLAITGKTEDVPRLLTAYTKIAKVGEWIGLIAKQAGLDVPLKQTLF